MNLELLALACSDWEALTNSREEGLQVAHIHTTVSLGNHRSADGDFGVENVLVRQILNGQVQRLGLADDGDIVTQSTLDINDLICRLRRTRIIC